MLFKFFFTVITMNAIISLIIFCFTGLMVYPWWLWELIFSFYWFSAVFHSLNKNYLDPTSPRTFLWDLKPMIAWVFSIHLVAGYAISFGILCPMQVSFGGRALIAYLGSYVAIVAIPMQLAVIFYPKIQKKLESQRADPRMIQSLAMQCGEAQDFCQRFSPIRTFVSDHAWKNQIATCFLAHRFPRRERDGLWEEVVLAIPVDMSRKKGLGERIQVDRYLFQVEEGRSTVFHLPVENWMEEHARPKPLDSDTLNKFDTLLDRFPTLEEMPFPLAVRKVAFERIECA